MKSAQRVGGVLHSAGSRTLEVSRHVAMEPIEAFTAVLHASLCGLKGVSAVFHASGVDRVTTTRPTGLSARVQDSGAKSAHLNAASGSFSSSLAIEHEARQISYRSIYNYFHSETFLASELVEMNKDKPPYQRKLFYLPDGTVVQVKCERQRRLCDNASSPRTVLTRPSNRNSSTSTHPWLP